MSSHPSSSEYAAAPPPATRRAPRNPPLPAQLGLFPLTVWPADAVALQEPTWRSLVADRPEGGGTPQAALRSPQAASGRTFRSGSEVTTGSPLVHTIETSEQSSSGCTEVQRKSPRHRGKQRPDNDRHYTLCKLSQPEWRAAQLALPLPLEKGTNPFSDEARNERAHLRVLLSKAHHAIGDDRRGTSIRYCEGAKWLWTKETPRRKASPVCRVDENGGLHPRCKVSCCNSRICPFCAVRRAYDLRAQMVPLMRLRFACKKPALLTLTKPDRPGQPLDEAMAELLTAWKAFRRRPEFRHYVAGGVYALEVTRNQASGSWHPHIHVIADITEQFPQKSVALPIWRDCLGHDADDRFGGMVNIKRVTVRGVVRHDDTATTEDVNERCFDIAAREGLKYITKGVKALRTWTVGEVTELLQWMRGRRMVHGFGSLYDVRICDNCGWNGRGKECQPRHFIGPLRRDELRSNADERLCPECSHPTRSALTDVEEIEDEDTNDDGFEHAGVDLITGELVVDAECEWRSDDEASRVCHHLLAKQWARRRGIGPPILAAPS